MNRLSQFKAYDPVILLRVAKFYSPKGVLFSRPTHYELPIRREMFLCDVSHHQTPLPSSSKQLCAD
jgi:hypothetical protein